MVINGNSETKNVVMSRFGIVEKAQGLFQLSLTQVGFAHGWSLLNRILLLFSGTDFPIKNMLAEKGCFALFSCFRYHTLHCLRVAIYIVVQIFPCTDYCERGIQILYTFGGN